MTRATWDLKIPGESLGAVDISRHWNFSILSTINPIPSGAVMIGKTFFLRQLEVGLTWKWLIQGVPKKIVTRFFDHIS